MSSSCKGMLHSFHKCALKIWTPIEIDDGHHVGF
jgi:hypothetical protein